MQRLITRPDQESSHSELKHYLPACRLIRQLQGAVTGVSLDFFNRQSQREVEHFRYQLLVV
ncbi:hypothetical protein D3C84_593030 [compost metagenome]